MLVLPRLYENPFHPPAAGSASSRLVPIEAALVRVIKRNQQMTAVKLHQALNVELQMEVASEDFHACCGDLIKQGYMRDNGLLLEYIP